MSSFRAGFVSNLRGYLNTARIMGAFSTKRVSRATKSMLADPVEPVEPVYAYFEGSAQSPETQKDDKVFSQNLLANEVLDKLLHIHNEIAASVEMDGDAASNPSRKVARAYQETQDRFVEDDAVTFHIGN